MGPDVKKKERFKFNKQFVKIQTALLQKTLICKQVRHKAPFLLKDHQLLHQHECVKPSARYKELERMSRIPNGFEWHGAILQVLGCCNFIDRF